MTASSFVHLVASLIEASIGAPASPAAIARVDAALAAVGMAQDRLVPTYFVDAVQRMVAGATAPWTPVPEPEHGLGWVLGNLSDVVEGTRYDGRGAQDRLVVPGLRRGVVVERIDGLDGRREQYAVVELEVDGRVPGDPPAHPEPTILGTFQPSVEQIRRWAYDLDVYFASQDEERAIDDPGFLELLVELAGDPACPKRERILAVIGELNRTRATGDGTSGAGGAAGSGPGPPAR